MRDRTGAPLPGVMVTLAGRALHRSAVTTEHGEFWVKALPPGRYVVTFALPGFAPHTRPGVDVASGGVVRIDIVLQVALHAEVTVTGRYTFRNLAELDPLESGQIGLAPSASVGVVTARQMGQRPIQRPAEVLETVPGLSVTQHSGEGKATQSYLRGFNLDHSTDFATSARGRSPRMGPSDREPRAWSTSRPATDCRAGGPSSPTCSTSSAPA